MYLEIALPLKNAYGLWFLLRMNSTNRSASSVNEPSFAAAQITVLGADLS